MKSLKELPDAKKALEVEIAERISKIPTRSEVKAIVARTAEKFGFQYNLKTDTLDKIIVFPKDFHARVYIFQDFNYDLEDVSTEANFGETELECDFFKTDDYSTPDGFLKAAEEITLTANLAKELQNQISMFRRNYNATSSGIVLESGDEKLIARYIRVLQSEIEDFEGDNANVESRIQKNQNEIYELENSNEKCDKERITLLKSDISAFQKRIAERQFCISIRQNEIEKAGRKLTLICKSHA